MTAKRFDRMTDEQLKSYIDMMTDEVEESEAAIGQAGCWVNRKTLAADRKALRAAKAEMDLRRR